jgi:hypothetical protein
MRPQKLQLAQCSTKWGRRPSRLARPEEAERAPQGDGKAQVRAANNCWLNLIGKRPKVSATVSFCGRAEHDAQHMERSIAPGPARQLAAQGAINVSSLCRRSS